MRLSAKERIGLRAIVELAHHYGQGPTSLREIAEVQGLPLPYLERIVASLKRAQLLISVRGSQGGYLLARAPSAITVSDVLRAVEGSLVHLDCMGGDVRCNREATCATRTVWEGVMARLRETLDHTTLADLLSESPATATESRKENTDDRSSR
jgi:Rrf2 family transcriptional regulator, cysteine metabolism repressor